MDSSDLRPSVYEIVEAIHDANGLAFLAHPFQYQIDDLGEFLDSVVKECKLDGIECYYTTFTSEQSNYLMNYALSRKLYISGGSDYHGKKRVNHNLGIGSGNLRIESKIIKEWNI